MYDTYFDLTNSDADIDSIKITADDNFNCSIKSLYNTVTYNGFILAKTPQGNVMTICEIDFQRSATDNKYQPRPTFRRVDTNFHDVTARADARNIRISFLSGHEGYREFWKMIGFIARYKKLVDIGDFEGSYQVISKDSVVTYLNNSNHQTLSNDLEGLNIDSSSEINSITTLRVLKSVKAKLQAFISEGSTETDVQQWIDEDDSAHRQRRCLIFGLEYLNFYREGTASSKRFDVLTRIGNKNTENVIIELKSPSSDMFTIRKSETMNEPTSEYALDSALSRSIPQILEYKTLLESKSAGDPDLEKIGIKDRKATITKCIIVIGKNKTDARWVANKRSLLESLNSTLEIWTYTDLLNKLESSIDNLEYKEE